MIRFRTLAVGGAAALTLGGAALIASPGSPAAAAGDPVVGMQVLDKLCVAKGGQPFNTPFTISRCQGARAKEGFELERLICEGLLEGTFRSVPSANRPNRVNWFCFPGALDS